MSASSIVTNWSKATRKASSQQTNPGQAVPGLLPPARDPNEFKTFFSWSLGHGTNIW
jgi:hypothetical protein